MGSLGAVLVAVELGRLLYRSSTYVSGVRGLVDNTAWTVDQVRRWSGGWSGDWSGGGGADEDDDVWEVVGDDPRGDIVLAVVGGGGRPGRGAR